MIDEAAMLEIQAEPLEGGKLTSGLVREDGSSGCLWQKLAGLWLGQTPPR